MMVVRIPEALFKKAKIAAVKRSETLAALVIKALEEHLSKGGKP